MIAKFRSFVKTDIWRMRLKDYSPTHSFLIRQLRIIVLATRGFIENKCKYRASALTFYSLLSIVPVLAMMFGIAKGFGFEKNVETQILKNLQGQEEIASRIINFSNSLLQNASGGFIAGVGILILFWTIISVLSNIESAFNEIWGVKKARSFGRKFSDYLSIMLVCPFLLVVSSSATVVISSQARLLIQKLGFLGQSASLLLLSLNLLPYLAIWITFTFIFIFMPNAKVRLKSGIFAGIVAGTVFQLTQGVYIDFQIGVANYSAIYGSFAALPLFLIWMQISWFIVLFGAELSFAHQNVDTYEFEQDCLSVSHSFKILLSLLITHLLVKNFCKAQKPLDDAEISRVLDIPIRLVRQILYELTESGIISEARRNEEKDIAYQPACDVDQLTVKYVIDSLGSRGNTDIPVIRSTELEKLSDCLTTFGKTIESSPANVLLKSI
jgi:membrane protein